jgi:hypothetical protein
MKHLFVGFPQNFCQFDGNVEASTAAAIRGGTNEARAGPDSGLEREEEE